MYSSADSGPCKQPGQVSSPKLCRAGAGWLNKYEARLTDGDMLRRAEQVRLLTGKVGAVVTTTDLCVDLEGKSASLVQVMLSLPAWSLSPQGTAVGFGSSVSLNAALGCPLRLNLQLTAQATACTIAR